MKEHLKQYLNEARQAILWKLEDLDDHQIRQPKTPTGTNLLGLVKHLTGCEAGYFSFGRPFDIPWLDNPEPGIDMRATDDESREEIVDRYKRACAHADETIDALPLDATTNVWGQEVTLHKILVHMIAETHRHAGHADIVRELIDGAVGRLKDD
ncbi:DinB family protein [Allokutzneria sp. A3M-2-11 16]|uniref:DinB family protein n=1 Tax=Allokutzneria sp. A3M-2-11 16 TaxID=2962043 RepID=UPI0020B6C8D8|nr:DinB family protein [Allokutzneria sp. A3M-2-11 16]MCP3802187.1 DinB family protein [Allokutzneria sp. A3M-2-11 16]